MSENTYRHIGSFVKKKDAESLATGKNFLFAVAIDEYVHCPKLYNAVNDAKELIAVLNEKYHFEAANTITLFNQEATEENIDKSFLQLTEMVTPEDNLVIYFSGHGEFDQRRSRGYWVPVDAEQGAYHNYISNTEIRDNLDAIESKHTFLIADSCFSGSLFATYKSTGAVDRLEKDPSRWGLTAGRTELVLDGKPGSNSPFADSLIYQLRNATKPLGVSELCNKIIEAVISNADQTPRGEPLKVKGHQGGQFFFHPRQDEGDVWTIAKQKNSTESYMRYLELFPAGQFFQEANEKIHALKEAEVWAFTKRENTATAYLNYIKEYRNSKHYTQAVEALAVVEEEECWADANLKNTLSGFLEYSLKYPKGKYLDKANSRIEAFEKTKEREAAALQNQKLRAAKQAEQEASTEKQRAQFHATIEDAETLFNQEDFDQAREKYRESMNYFRTGFTPNMAYIEKKLDDCIKKIKLAGLIEDGKNAYLKSNYSLALQYFNKAAEIDKTKKVLDWIKTTNQKIKLAAQPKTTTTSTNTHTAVPHQVKAEMAAANKSTFKMIKWILGGVAAIFVIAFIGFAVVFNSIDDSMGTYDEAVEMNSGIFPIDGNLDEQEDYILDNIVNTWKVADVESGGFSQAAAGTLPHEVWAFHQDGNVFYTGPIGNVRYSYFVNGNNLVIETFMSFTIVDMTSDKIICIGTAANGLNSTITLKTL